MLSSSWFPALRAVGPALKPVARPVHPGRRQCRFTGRLRANGGWARLANGHAAGRLMATPRRASALRAGRHDGEPGSGHQPRLGVLLGKARHTAWPAGHSEPSPARGARGLGLRVLVRALALSPDSMRGQAIDDEMRIAAPSVTRQSHWTWRFIPVPWGRYSSGRKRRSGRRSSDGSPWEDHVKVAGWGAIPCLVGWHASRTGFGPVQVVATSVANEVEPRFHTLRGPGLPASIAGDGHRWHVEALKWRSPREHRASGRRQRRLGATDFTADQGPEVE